MAQIIQRRLNGIRHLRQTSHGFGIGGDIVGDAASDQGFRRRKYAGHVRNLGHGESTVHGVDGAEKRIVIIGMAGDGSTLQPFIDRLQMTGDFGLQNFKQHRIDDRLRRRFRFRGFRHGRGGDRRPGNCGNDFRCLLLLVINVFACRKALRYLVQAGKIETDAFTGQGPVEYRQRGDGTLDHHHDRIRNRPRAVQNPVQQAFDFPAEFAERFGADQAATAFQGVEYAPDRADQLDVFGIALPVLEEALQIGILFVELFKEDLADFIIDAFRGEIETIDEIPGFIDDDDRTLGLR